MIPPMKLRDWIDINKLNWCLLSQNPNAIYLLEKNPMKIDKWKLSKNSNPSAKILYTKLFGTE